MYKLKIEHKHMLKLIDRETEKDGWTPISDALYPHLLTNMPNELVVFDGTAGSYKAKLTDEGQNIVKAMAWL